ncbi:MAG: hypothetical protein KC729_04065, partial [Candidatus Eisenbacteria bacterium]|nr:hypothetical protein [Candidatus Eisenbacteria bacterium]
MTTHDTPDTEARPGPSIGIGTRGTSLRPIPKAGSTDPGADPFITLSPSGGPIRTYLAEIHVGDLGSGLSVALMMEPNQYDEARPGSPAEAGNNEQIARNWAAGFAATRLAGGHGLASLEALGVPAGVPEGSAPHHPPVAYCKKTGRYAIPVCPETLGPLEICRDEALLRRCGLPSYRDTLARFLYSPAAVRPGRPVTFYTYSLARFETGPEATLRRRGELYRDLLPRVREGVASPPADHPCFACEHRDGCYPAGSTLEAPIPAEEQLFPLAYYDFHYLPRTPLLLACDEAAAVLGGSSIRETLDMREMRRELASEPQGQHLTAALSPPNQQFFFEGDRTGLFVLECLYLKLTAISRVLQGLLNLQRNAGRPHLGLSPTRLRAAYRAEASHLPARWSVDLQLTDAVSTAPLASLDRERVPDEPIVWAIPQPRVEPFLPSGMLKPQIQTLSMRVETRKLDSRTEGPKTILELDARLVSESFAPTEHGRHDLIRVVASSSTGRVVFGGRMRESSPGGFRFIGRSAGLDADAARRVQEHLDGSVVEVVIARAFGAPSDLVALGRLFLRFLFWNDRRDAAKLEPARLDRVAARLAEALGVRMADTVTLR